MNEITFEAIGVILAADTALLIAFLAYVSPKYAEYIQERRKLLDEKFSAKVNEVKKTEITIEKFLPLFEEYETVESWGKILKQIYLHLGYSALLTLVGLFFHLLDSYVTVANIPVEVLFTIGGGVYLLVALYVIINHAIEVNK